MMNVCGRSRSSRFKTGFHLCEKNSPIHQSDSPDTPLCRPNIVYNRILLRTNSPQSLPRMTRVSAHSWNWYLLVLAGLLVLCQDSLPLDWFHTQLTKPATWCLTRIYWILDNQVTEGHTVVMPVELGYLMLDSPGPVYHTTRPSAWLGCTLSEHTPHQTIQLSCLWLLAIRKQLLQKTLNTSAVDSQCLCGSLSAYTWFWKDLYQNTTSSSVDEEISQNWFPSWPSSGPPSFSTIVSPSAHYINSSLVIYLLLISHNWLLSTSVTMEWIPLCIRFSVVFLVCPFCPLRHGVPGKF